MEFLIYNYTQTDQCFFFFQTITGDLGGKAKTHEYADAVIKNL